MKKIEELSIITTKPQLAILLGIKAQFLTHVLYRLTPDTQYTIFDVPKKNGGNRTISAPSDKLKIIQLKLSKLLLDCIDEINETNTKKYTYKHALSHGFVRECSIMTNAVMHLNQKNVLNIDLKDFFDSFNFGRVRGFFIKNNHFKLDPHIATVIAQIACYKNKLPQGSPCSPVITNLITHSLDIKLASLARKHSCIYSRYVDDITFSTRELKFPTKLMSLRGENYFVGKRLRSQIENSGFFINETKTRIQYQNSRQDVTGLIVNKKPNVKKEYWRTVRSKCHSIFRTGSFFKETDAGHEIGNFNELQGQLNFIDQVDFFNRLRQKTPIDNTYVVANHKLNNTPILNGREKTYSRFLYYRMFYGNTEPTILCEGKTDNVYLKSAINILANHYPKIATPNSKTSKYTLLIRFVKYTRRTKFLMGLDGGSGSLIQFINKFQKHYQFYKAPVPQHPVILILDNDKGFISFPKNLKSISSTIAYPETLDKEDYINAEFIHVIHNLYIVLTPLGSKAEQTDIESLFDDVTRLKKYKGRHFNTIDKRDEKVDLSKESFSNQIIKIQKSSINFDGFKPLLDRVTAVIDHYNSIK